MLPVTEQGAANTLIIYLISCSNFSRYNVIAIAEKKMHIASKSWTFPDHLCSEMLQVESCSWRMLSNIATIWNIDGEMWEPGDGWARRVMDGRHGQSGKLLNINLFN